MTVIGIVGQPSSGKDTVVNYLVTKGFTHISSGNLLRAEMKKLDIPTDRAHMSDYSAKACKERGPGFLAGVSVRRVTGNTVISGARHTVEIEVFRKAFGKDFILIAIEASLEIRYKRALARSRIGDNIISFEQFKQEEEIERRGNPDAYQVDEVINVADRTILNDGTEEELFKKIDELFINLK